MSKIRKDSFLQPYSIGLKLRTLRNEKGFTLAGLAAATGFSTALLSKFETGRMIPTLPTLARLCQVYGIGMGYFFSDSKHHSLAITRKAHISRRARGYQAPTRTRLNAPTSSGKLLATILELPPEIPSSVSATKSRTELFLYVLDGRLRINTAGSEDVLETGDCAVLDTEESVIWAALGESRCRIVTVSAGTLPE